MKQRILISAIYTSPPDSMGGNTKIVIEMINNTVDIYTYIILTSQPKTFYNNIKHPEKITIISIDFPYTRNNYKTHLSEIRHVYKIYKLHFTQLQITKNDICITQSDFAPDVIPIYWLKKNFGFTWIATLFLFIPHPFVNGIKGYFPFFKYTIYRIYQKVMFLFMKLRGSGFIITNHSDVSYFGKNDKVLPIYGGVNIEQLQANSKLKKYDAIFCGRLHPQKGVGLLLEIWAQVICELPKAKLAIIGNGSKEYEAYLHKKSLSLGVEGNIDRLGYVNNEEKYILYSQSRMLLHTSVYDNNGMVAAEALCQGLPVIMHDLPALRNIYTTGCYKVRCGDKDGFSKQIIKLIQAPVELSSDHIQKNIIQRSRNNKAKEFIDFIKQCL